MKRHKMVLNRNLLFIIGFRSHFLTDFKFSVLEILSIKLLRKLSIEIFKYFSQSDEIGHFSFVNF